MGEADKWIITNEGGQDIELGGMLDELAWEFVAEHHRRQDLIRFGKFNNAWWEKSASDITRRTFPIPQWVIDSNPNLE